LCGPAGEFEAGLLPGGVVLSWLTVLNFRPAGGGRIAVMMCTDNVESAVFRQLRVRLRMGPVGRLARRPGQD
jgi:hypothetical protein